MLNNKKGVFPLVAVLSLLLNPIVLIILGIILGVLLLIIIISTFGFAFFLTSNIFLLLGAFLVIVGGIGLLMKFTFQIGLTLIVIGLGLLLLPNLFEGLTGITLAAMLP